MFGQAQSPRQVRATLDSVLPRATMPPRMKGTNKKAPRKTNLRPHQEEDSRLPVDGDQSGAQEAHSSRANRNPRGISAAPLIDEGSCESLQYLMAENAALEQQNPQLMRSASTSELSSSLC